MDSPTLVYFQQLSQNPSSIDYLLFNLPKSVPAIITFLFGLYLSIIAFISFVKKEYNFFILAFSLTMLSISFAGLGSVFQTILNDPILAKKILEISYCFFFLFFPFTTYFVYLITGSKYRHILYLTGISHFNSIIALYLLFSNKLFTNEFIMYDFGLCFPIQPKFFPWAYWSLWGLIGYIFVLTIIYRFSKEFDRNVFKLILSFNLLLLSIGGTLPFFLGKDFPPTVPYSFIPIALILYYTYKIDYLNINDYLYRKNFLFYFITGLISVGFFISAIIFIIFFKPTHYLLYIPNTFPYFILPGISSICCFVLGLYIIGSNPEEKINILSGVFLIVNGFFANIQLLATLPIEILAYRRAIQLNLVFFLLIASVSLKLYLNLRGKQSRYFAKLTDVATLCLIIYSLFDSYHPKFYYEYSFYRTPSVGNGTIYFLMIIVAVLSYIIFDFIKSFRTLTIFTKLFIYIILFMALLNSSNFFSFFGTKIFPPSYFLFVPVLLYTICFFHFGFIPNQGRIQKAVNAVSSITFTLIPLVFIFYFSTYSGFVEWREIAYHCLLISFLFAISFYGFTFIVSRPIALSLQQSFTDLETEKQRVERREKQIHLLWDESSRSKEKTTELLKKIQKDLLVAKSIQETFYPLKTNQFSGIHYDFVISPAQEVGGDSLEIHELEP